MKDLIAVSPIFQIYVRLWVTQAKSLLNQAGSTWKITSTVHHPLDRKIKVDVNVDCKDNTSSRRYSLIIYHDVRERTVQNVGAWRVLYKKEIFTVPTSYQV